MSSLKCPTPLDVKYPWHSVLRVITIRWSHLQSVSNKPLKLCIICRLATLIGNHLTREPTVSPVLTKCWNLELMLTTNFGSQCQTVTKFGSQNFGCQIWFCTRLISDKSLLEHVEPMLMKFSMQYGENRDQWFNSSRSGDIYTYIYIYMHQLTRLPFLIKFCPPFSTKPFP